MAEFFDITYPPDGRIKLDGGKNNKFQVTLIDDSESPDCKNVIFTDGAVGTRGGSSKLNTTSVGSYACDGLYTRDDNSGNSTLTAFFGGHMYYFNGTSFTTVPSAQSVFSAGVRMAATQYENYMFMGNGTVNPYKYDGTYFNRHGVTPPSLTYMSQDASGYTGSGLLTGAYQYKITFVNSASVESDVSTATTLITLASQKVSLTLGTAPVSFGVMYKRIYRTAAGGSTFLRLTEQSAAAATYLDNTADASLGVAAPTDNGVPPNYSVVEYHKDRLFCNDPDNPNLVWFSNLGDPYTFASTNFIQIGDNTSDVVTGLKAYENNIIVFCTNSVHLIHMPDTDENNWTPIRIRSPYGSKSPFGYVFYNNKVMFPAQQNTKFVGFAAVGGTTIDPDQTAMEGGKAGSDLKSNTIESDMFDVDETYLGDIFGAVYKNRAYFTVREEADSYNSKIYVYDFSFGNLLKVKEGVWVPYTGLSLNQFAVYNGNLYGGSSIANGRVYQLETDTYADDGVAIDSYIKTKEFNGLKGHDNWTKDFRKANFLVEKIADYDMNVTYYVDSDRGVGTTVTIDLNPGGAVWNSVVWGSFTWGDGQSQEDIKKYLGATRGKRIQFKFSNQNTLNQGFKIHSFNFTYNLKGKR